ncbi:MAG TPA: GntR family transcriptional regulator [Bacillota bacterium]|nr:GntR family transcriptional regulator [Bacillota bacterium]HOR85177.1 GntR family transcriptional regulator [Bacillota bacterium]
MDITVSNSAHEPIYEQIANQIKKLIINQQLKPGEGLPSIRKLAADLHISVITTKRAYDELEKEGFIETVIGKGCFVSKENKDFIREKRIRMVEDKLSEAIKDSRILNIGLQGLKVMLEVLYREGV